MNDTLIRHIRNSANVPVATVVAVKTPEGVRTGYSICHSRLDRYNKKEGVQRAKLNALEGIRPVATFRVINRWDKDTMYPTDVTLMDVISRQEEILKNRAHRYFKVPVETTGSRYEKMSHARRIAEGLLLLEDNDMSVNTSQIYVCTDKEIDNSIAEKLTQLGWRENKQYNSWYFNRYQ